MTPARADARPPLEYEPWLVEEAVLHAIRGRRLEPEFRRERDRAYAHADVEERDAAFRQLHARWFAALDLDAPLRRALEELPILARETRACRVAAARARTKEGADLYVQQDAALAPRQRRVILVRMMPARFSTPESLLELLRHELLHVADMLDPAFGYEPSLQCSGSDPSFQSLIRGRYRVLWKATVAGRLLGLGRAQEDRRAQCWAEFIDTFPLALDAAEAAFSRWFDTPVHTHAEMVAFAHDPGGGSKRCPLCGSLAYDLCKPPRDLVAVILRDFADWSPESAVCRQCADLYAGHAQASG